MTENEKDCVEFCNKSRALPGALAGAVIAIGVPAVVLTLGKSLGPSMEFTLTIIGIAVGGLIALTSTFFSLAIPSKVNGFGCGCGGENSTPRQTVTGNSVTQSF